MISVRCVACVVLAVAGVSMGADVPGADYSAGAFTTQMTMDGGGTAWAFDGRTVYRLNGGVFGPMDQAGDMDCALGFDPASILFTADSATLVLLRGWGGWGVPTPPAGYPQPPFGGVAVYHVGTNTIDNLDNLDNIPNYAGARAADGTLYVNVPEPGVANMLYKLDISGEGSMTAVLNLDPDVGGGLGINSGAVGFDAAGNLYAAPFRQMVAGLGPGEVPLLTIAADKMAAPTTADIQLLGTLAGMNGSQSLAVQDDGTLLVACSTGVRWFDPATGAGFDVLGDTADPDFFTPAVTVSGDLVKDPITGQVYAVANGEVVAVPEPATLAAMGLGGLLLAVRRRRNAA